MPASRIPEGSLPERHPKAQIFSRAQPQPKTESERDIKGEARGSAGLAIALDSAAGNSLQIRYPASGETGTGRTRRLRFGLSVISGVNRFGRLWGRI
jgi:hypothetical protein